MLRERKLLPKRLKLMAKYEKLCVHKEKKTHHIFLFNIDYFLFCWVFFAAHRLALIVATGRSTLSLWCVGFSCCGTQALGMQASVAATLRL